MYSQRKELYHALVNNSLIGRIY